MSGGSWDYISDKFDEVGDRLIHEDDPKRAALGHLVHRVAKALHAIEWNDSGDGHPGEGDLIMACVTKTEVLVMASARLAAEVERAKAVRKEFES